MKKLLLLLLWLPAVSFSQSFSSPESVEYDVANGRWLVGQHNSGQVLVYTPSSGTLSIFCSGMTGGPYGIEIMGNVLYCCVGGSIKGYSLTSGSQVFTLNLGASFLNGITSDGNNFLFVTDFTAKKIYRVNVAASSFNLMTSTVKTPNGIIYDGAHNRCVFVTWGASAPVQAMSLADSTISTVRATSLGNCDGIIRDQHGNWYVSAWTNNALNKIDSAFSSNPVNVMSSLSSPADLGINAAGDSIGIPNSGTANNVVFYHVPVPTGIENETEHHHANLFPNPSNEKTTIAMDIPVNHGIIELTDMAGRIITSKEANGYLFILDREGLPAGNYLVTVKENDGKIIFVQKVMYR